MRDLKYIFTGLAISVILFLLLIGAFVLLTPESISPEIPLPDFLNTPTFTPIPSDRLIPPAAPTSTNEPTLDSPSFTPSPTDIPFTATATASPTATATLSPGQVMELNGSLAITGPHTPEEQIRLYETSLHFVAPTFSEARKLGEQINGKGYGSPTLICGPLSIAILRAAGLIPDSTIPYSFWQLNPDDGVARVLLRSVFPPSQYTDTRVRDRIDRYDWKSNPLQPGDFIYIYAGNGGNFEHMLVVNRVDNTGRAYSVTNFGTPDGFIITEVMLYDPNDARAGMFAQWTAREWALLGSTGFDGFELWRLIPTEPTPSP
jgi:hypothetical protein